MGASNEEMLDSYGSGIGKADSTVGRIREWVLVRGDRLVVAALVPVAGVALYLGLEWLDLVAFQNEGPMTRLASGLVAGSFSLVTLVVSINQLILSQEFTTAGQARDRESGIREFRSDIAETADVPAAPASPTRLLELLAEEMHYRAETLSESVADHDDEEVRDVVEKYAERVQASTERMGETLERTEFGSFYAVSATIRYDTAWQLYVAEHLSGRYEDALSEESLEALDGLVETLELLDIAEEHFKTTYLQRELTQFSRLTVYAGIPAVLAAVGLALLYADVGGASVNPRYLPIVSTALVGVVVLPLGLLGSYVLRTATVTRRTVSIGPMLPEKDPDEGPFEVSAEEDGE